MPQDNLNELVAIDHTKSAMENMHILINAAALEPFETTDYSLSPPRAVSLPAISGTPAFNNTQITITSTSDRFTGSDDQYYHRVDIGNRGAKDSVLNKRIIPRHIELPYNVIHPLNPEEALKLVCNHLELVPTEFLPLVDTTALESGTSLMSVSHWLKAKPESHLYIGELGVFLTHDGIFEGPPV